MSFYIVFIEPVAALGTEFRRIFRVFRLPTALIAAVERCALGLFAAAVLAEFSLVHRSARAGPAGFVRRLGRAALRTELRRILRIFRLPSALVTLIKRFSCRLLGSAFRTEFALVDCAAGTYPSICCNRLW